MLPPPLEEAKIFRKLWSGRRDYFPQVRMTGPYARFRKQSVNTGQLALYRARNPIQPLFLNINLEVSQFFPKLLLYLGITGVNIISTQLSPCIPNPVFLELQALFPRFGHHQKLRRNRSAAELNLKFRGLRPVESR